MGINEDLGKEALKEARLKARKELEEQILELKKQQADKTYEQFEIEVKMEAQAAAAAKRQAERQMDLAKSYQEEIELARIAGTLRAEDQTRLEALVKTHRDAALAAQETALAAEATADALSDAADYGENLIGRLTGISDKPKSFAGKLLADPDSMTKGLMAAGSKMITPMNILTSSVDKDVESTIALALESDQAVVNFRKSTGASGEFDSTIRGLERSLFNAGVTSAEAGEAVQSLFLNVTGFTEMGPETVKQVGETVAILAELGVNSKTTAENIQFATKVMSMSGAQAEELTRDLFTFAQELQVSGDQIASDFAAMGPTIAALGEQGVQAFKDLQVQSKATGLAMDTMLKITEQFDTFDGAAQSVGKLNALLGGPYLNTLEMVTETDPSKRMDLMRDATLTAGLAFDDLSYYQKKAYTSALGLNNEMELAMFLGGNMDQIAPPQKSAADMEELAKQTAQFNTIMEELTQLGMALAVSLGPLISAFKVIINFIADYGVGIMAATAFLGIYHAAQAGVFFMLRTEGVASIGAMSTAEKASMFLGGAMLFLTLLSLMPEKFRALAIGIGLVVAAVWALSVAEKSTVILGLVGILVAGIAQLVHSMTVGNSPSLVQAFMMVAAAVPILGLALLGIMPILPALLFFLPFLVFGFIKIANALGPLIGQFALLASDSVVANLMSVASAIREIGNAINDLETNKAIMLTHSVNSIAMAAPAMAITRAVVGSATKSTAGGASAGAGASGPPPVINVHLSVDGTEFATAVNKVEIEKYVAGTKSDMHASIVDMLKEGFLSSS